MAEVQDKAVSADNLASTTTGNSIGVVSRRLAAVADQRFATVVDAVTARARGEEITLA